MDESPKQQGSDSGIGTIFPVCFVPVTRFAGIFKIYSVSVPRSAESLKLSSVPLRGPRNWNAEKHSSSERGTIMPIPVSEGNDF